MQVSLALILLVSSAHARTGEDETFVSARKQSEPLKDVPLSATVVSGAELELAHELSVREAAVRVPNTMFSEFSARRLSFPFVRGIGSGTNDPAVITYVDDVPQFGFGGTNLPLVAVDRIEFLRGPQGTLYGRNALGGLIHVHGRRPSDVARYDLGAGFGSYDLREYSGSFSGPIGGGARADLALLDSQREGFTRNRFSGNRVDDRDGFFGRGRVLWNPGESSELDFSVFGERARDGGFVLSDLAGLRADAHRIDQDYEGIANRDVVNPALVWRVFGERLDFTSVSSFETWDVLETSDFDFSQLDGVRRRSSEDQSYLYQELRLGTPEGAARGAPRWLVGLSGFRADGARQATNNFRPGGAGILFPPANVGLDRTQGDFDDTGWAAFGELSVPVAAALELNAGLRYDRERKEAQRMHTFDPGFGPILLDSSDDARTFDEFLPMLGASWHPCEEAMVFARAARGFKAGGFNLAAPAGKEDFGPEKAWSYELGVRGELDGGRHTLGATLFLVDWQDMQLSQFDASVGGYVDNAGESQSKGIELEARSRIQEGLDGFASVGLLATEIDEFTDSFGTDTSGNDLPFAPDSTWSLGLVWSGDMASGARWSLQGDYGRVGDFFYDAGNRAGDSFGLANFRAGLEGRRFGFSVWVQNAFDEEYQVVAFQPSPIDPNTFVGESGTPRVLGFTLSVHL